MSIDLYYEECTMRAVAAATARQEKAEAEELRKLRAGTVDESNPGGGHLRELVNELDSQRMPDRKQRKRLSAVLDEPLTINVFPRWAGESIEIKLPAGSVIARASCNQYIIECDKEHATFELKGKPGKRQLHLLHRPHGNTNGARPVKRSYMGANRDDVNR